MALTPCPSPAFRARGEHGPHPDPLPTNLRLCAGEGTKEESPHPDPLPAGEGTGKAKRPAAGISAAGVNEWPHHFVRTERLPEGNPLSNNSLLEDCHKWLSGKHLLI